MESQNQTNSAEKKINDLEKQLAESKEVTKDLFTIIENLESQVFILHKDKNDDFVVLFSEGKIAKEQNNTTQKTKGKLMREILGEDLYSELKPHYDKAFTGKMTKYRGFEFNDRYYSTALFPFKKDENNNVIEIIGNTIDITEIYQTEIEFKKKTDTLDRIIEFNPYSIQLLNAEGYHVSGNKAYLELFIKPPPPEWSIFKDPIIKDSEYYDIFLRVLDGEVVTTPPVWYNAHLVDSETPDNLICVGSVMFPIFLSDGKLEFIVVMHEDITARINAENNLKERIKELEDFHDLTVGRELKMKRMEEEITELKRKLNIKMNNK